MIFGSFCDTAEKGTDIVYMHSNDTVLPDIPSNCIAKKQHTLVNDLSLDEDLLLSNIKKNCRYEIRRSEREGAVVTFYTPDMLLRNKDVVERFQTVYNQMFQTKGMDSYSFNTALVSAGIQAGHIVISTCHDKEDPALEVFHAYLCDGDRCDLMYSASPVWMEGEKEKINTIGRLNKYLHWKDMVAFKNMQYSAYDWGGITDPDNPNGIGKFKMEFGGEVKTYYNYIVSHSLLGNLYIFLLKCREGRK